jgi:hypothetical protein
MSCIAKINIHGSVFMGILIFDQSDVELRITIIGNFIENLDSPSL